MRGAGVPRPKKRHQRPHPHLGMTLGYRTGQREFGKQVAKDVAALCGRTAGRLENISRGSPRCDRNNEACAMKLTVNGQRRVLQEVDPTMPLLWAVRDLLGLKGTKFGCGQALCGACTVHLDGQPIRSCQTSLADVGDGKVTTIEAIAGRVAEAVKSAWIKNNVPQCGYCQSGQIMSAVALLESNPKPSRDDINSAMSGNLCRCGTYPRIRAAIADASNVLEHQ